jgi:AraC family transcriptional regulator
MDIFIKNMVCSRCVLVVNQIFASEGLEPSHIEIGRVTLDKEASPEKMDRIEKKLNEVGFEILTNQKRQIVEKIKTTIINNLQDNGASGENKLSRIISSALNKDYSSLSKLFSEAEGMTIERYTIDRKIDRVKELLAYGEKNINEIAFDLGYSSVAHLSSQFKKITGLSPTEFRQTINHRKVK